MSGRSTAQSDDGSGEVQYDPDSGRYDVYECTVSDCDNVILVVGSDDPPMSCHDQPMERVTDVEMSVTRDPRIIVGLESYEQPDPQDA